MASGRTAGIRRVLLIKRRLLVGFFSSCRRKPCVNPFADVFARSARGAVWRQRPEGFHNEPVLFFFRARWNVVVALCAAMDFARSENTRKKKTAYENRTTRAPQ